MKTLKTYQITTVNGTTHYVSAESKKRVRDFWVINKIKTIEIRTDIDPKENFIISPKNH